MTFEYAVLTRGISSLSYIATHSVLQAALVTVYLEVNNSVYIPVGNFVYLHIDNLIKSYDT